MWVSPAYRKEYCEWIDRGFFTEIYEREGEHFAEAIAEENPTTLASSLDSYATCIYRRGMVTLMANGKSGWPDVQCGYWAALYSLMLEAKGGAIGYEGVRRRMTEMVLLLGLARVFGQEGDALRLSELIAEHFSWQDAIGDRIQSGRKILQSILEPETPITYDQLLQDRKECCQKRDAWPKRPTEIDPFGVLDIEMILRFPAKAAFTIPSEFSPTDDDRITQAIVAYHSWYERPIQCEE